jgi:poly(3-hydroxybutyrate) depolymerase
MSQQRSLVCCMAYAALLVSACETRGPPAHVERHKLTLVHAGIDRTCMLQLPVSYDGSVPVPFVLALHGHGDPGA